MRNGAIRSLALLAVVLLLILSGNAQAGQHVLRDEGDEGKLESYLLVLPFAFYSESLAFAYGAGVVGHGYGQEQMVMGAAGYRTTNESWASYVYADDIRISNRWFMRLIASVGDYTEQRTHTDGNPEFPDKQSGSNESDPDDFISGSGWDNWFEVTFRYVLPFGLARDTVVNTYYLDRGIMVSGDTHNNNWNPFKAGRTNLDLQWFYRLRTFNHEEEEIGEGKTSGYQMVLTFDNRDFSPNPQQGSLINLEAARDFGWFISDNSWTTFTFDFSHYIGLPTNKHIRHQTFAFNFWTRVSPTWDEVESDEGESIHHKPPNYKAAALGGDLRMRAFPRFRFNDKAVLYYSAEYRIIPNWNPIADAEILEFLDIDWWQFVPFVEVGRVAPHWSLQTFHTDMQWDVGLGLRFMAMKTVVRIDMAFSEESASAYAMIGQPF